LLDVAYSNFGCIKVSHLLLSKYFNANFENAKAADMIRVLGVKENSALRASLAKEWGAYPPLGTSATVRYRTF
jgi:hypothetical protein